MSIENKLLTKLLESQEWEVIIDKGINADYFTGANKRAFKWLNSFMAQYGSLPTIETFKKHFPEVSLDFVVEEKLPYYCDEVRKKVRQNKLVVTLDSIAEKLNQGNVDDCYTDLSKLLMDVEVSFSTSYKIDLGTNAESRFDDYLISKEQGGLTGIPLNIQPIDHQTGGLKNVDLYTFFGKSGLGKSFLLCLIASNLVRAGYKVLFITKEMSPQQVLKRIDAIMAQVSYNRLKNGKLTQVEEEQYKTFLRDWAGRYKDRLSIELVNGGVTEVIAKADAYRPDVLLVDGGYLFSEGKDTEDWKEVTRVWKALKFYCLSRKTPTIVTSQLKEGKATVENINYARALLQYCDCAFGLQQDDVQRASKEITINTLKVRDGEYQAPFTMAWDWTNMKYDVLYTAYNSETKQGFLVKDEEPISLKKLE